MNSNILILPKYVFIPVLSEWLTLEDVGCLDVAICNSMLRPIFLLLINAQTLCFRFSSPTCTPPLSKTFISWLNLRGVSVDSLRFDGELKRYELVPFLVRCAKDTRRATCTTCESEESVKVLELLGSHCSNLNELSIVQFNGNKEANLRCGVLTSFPLTSLTFSYCNKLSANAMRNLMTDIKTLTSLKLERCTLSYTRQPSSGGVLNSTLESLDLTGCKLPAETSMEAVLALIEGCNRLARLSLSRIKYVIDPVLGGVAVHCPALASLDVSGCVYLSNAGIHNIALYCSELTSLNVQNCYRIGHEAMVAVGRNCQQLKSLTFGHSSRYRHDYPTCGINDDSIAALLRGCPNVTEWAIYDCSLTDRSIQTIVTQTGPNLTALRLHCGTFSVSSDSVISLAQHCGVSLTALALGNAEGVTNAALDLLLSRCTRLTDLSIANNRPPTALSSPFVKLATHCSRLTKLHIFENEESCAAHITRSCFYLISTHCLLLTELLICNSNEVNDHNIIHFTSYCNYVTSLHLSNCKAIVGDCVAAVARAWGRQLKSLSLVNNNGAPGIPDAQLMHSLPKHCHKLTMLDLSQNQGLSNRCVLRLLRYCGASLLTLNISYCDALTSAVSSGIALYCPHLVFLHLDYCPAISDASIFVVLRRCPLLHRVSMKGRLPGVGIVDIPPAGAAGDELFWLTDLVAMYPETVVM